MLPQGFTRVEWIQSDGTQRINTKYKPNQGTRLVMECTIDNAVTSSYSTLFGARDADLARCFALFVSPSNNFYPNIGIKTDYYNYPASVAVVGHHVIDANRNTITIDGNSYTFTARTFQNQMELFLFACNENGSATMYGAFKAAATQIYDNGTIVRDYIPCIDENGDANLWDDVNETLAEKVGTFIAGPAIPAPSSPVSLRTALAVRLLWDSVASADYYKIYRDGALIGTTTETQYIDTTAAENATYTYGISAANGGGESAPTELIVYTRSGYFLYKPYISTANFP